MMSFSLKFFVITLLLFFSLTLADAYQTAYNKDKLPMFEFNNTPLIEKVEGGYLDSNNISIGGRNIFLQDPSISSGYPISGKLTYEDSNIDYNYVFFGKNGLPLNNRNVDILTFNIDYKIKNKVEYIIPFLFDFGKWPKFIYSFDDRFNLEIPDIYNGKTYRVVYEQNKSSQVSELLLGHEQNKSILVGKSSLFVYGTNESILFPELPSPFEYVFGKINDSLILEVIGKNISNEGKLTIELNVSEYTPLESSKVNSFIENTIIYRENGKIGIGTEITKDVEKPVSFLMFFDNSDRIEKNSNNSEWNVTFSDDNKKLFLTSPFSNEPEMMMAVISESNWNNTFNINDNEKILLAVPFPNLVPSDLDIGFIQSNDFQGIFLNPLQVRRMNIKKYVKKFEILNLDRYVFPISYTKDPEIIHFPNKTEIYWNYSDVETPLALVGFVNDAQLQKLASSGDQILIIKPESNKYFSKEIFRINPPLNENEAPNKIDVERSDIRYPLKRNMLIPLYLNAPSDTALEYIKLNGDYLMGPWELRPNLSFDEGKYYSSKISKNSLSILFIKNTSDPIHVQLKYTRNISENIKKINAYTWNYSIYEVYPIGDISDYKQIYDVVLPPQYSFLDFPQDAVHDRKDGNEQIILEYNQSVRYRYINFSIISENLKEKAFPYNLIKILSWSWVVENMANNIFGFIITSIFAVILLYVIKNFAIIRKIKDKIDEIIR